MKPSRNNKSKTKPDQKLNLPVFEPLPDSKIITVEDVDRIRKDIGEY